MNGLLELARVSEHGNGLQEEACQGFLKLTRRSEHFSRLDEDPYNSLLELAEAPEPCSGLDEELCQGLLELANGSEQDDGLDGESCEGLLELAENPVQETGLHEEPRIGLLDLPGISQHSPQCHEDQTDEGRRPLAEAAHALTSSDQPENHDSKARVRPGSASEHAVGLKASKDGSGAQISCGETPSMQHIKPPMQVSQQDPPRIHPSTAAPPLSGSQRPEPAMSPAGWPGSQAGPRSDTSAQAQQLCGGPTDIPIAAGLCDSSSIGQQGLQPSTSLAAWLGPHDIPESGCALDKEPAEGSAPAKPSALDSPACIPIPADDSFPCDGPSWDTSATMGPMHSYAASYPAAVDFGTCRLPGSGKAAGITPAPSAAHSSPVYAGGAGSPQCPGNQRKPEQDMDMFLGEIPLPGLDYDNCSGTSETSKLAGRTSAGSGGTCVQLDLEAWMAECLAEAPALSRNCSPIQEASLSSAHSPLHHQMT